MAIEKRPSFKALSKASQELSQFLKERSLLEGKVYEVTGKLKKGLEKTFEETSPRLSQTFKKLDFWAVKKRNNPLEVRNSYADETQKRLLSLEKKLEEIETEQERIRFYLDDLD